MEKKYQLTAAMMVSILAFAVFFYLFWFFMSGKKEQAFHSFLWTGFLLAQIIPSPLGSLFVINEIAPLLTHWFDLAMGWLLVSSVTLWGILGFSIYYLEVKKFMPKAILFAKILAVLPLLVFAIGIVNYFFPDIFPYNPNGWDGFFYFPSTSIRSVILAIGFLFVAFLGFRIYLKGFKPALFYLIAYVPLTISAVLVSMSNMRMAFKGNAIGLPADLNELNNICMLIALVLFGLAIGYKQRMLEKEHLKAQEELLKVEQIKELDELKNRFYTNITHEFRTPLTVIMGMTDNIQGNEQEKKLILNNSQNLLRLINQLLDLSKLESGSLKLHMKQANIVAFCRYLTESFYSLAEENKIRLTFYAEEEEILMDYDEEKLQYIVYNLLSNALKFTPENGKVILHLKTADAFLQIKVQDTGTGIPEAQLPFIFDRFYQAEDTSSSHPGGTGIGLAYTKELSQLMGGHIEVSSEMGKGSIFTCYLPIHREASLQTESIRPISIQPAAETTATAGMTPASEHSDERPMILVVEDNPDLVSYLQTILQGAYDVHIARDGQQGIEQALELIPDLIISDVMMPRKNGYELCEALKTNVRSSHIPIILLTAKATQEDKVRGLTQGADAYLPKPFDKKELFVRIEKLIELRKSLQAIYASGVPAGEQETEASNQENEFLQQLREIVLKELDNAEFTIPELAERMAMSQIQVYRKLKALTGQTPSQFVRRIRLEAGKKLLQNTDKTVAEIAYEVGFSDPNYFSRSFHQAFGNPPGAFRKKL